MTEHVTQWIDAKGQRTEKLHPSESAAETHARTLVAQGITQVTFFEAQEVQE